MSVVTETLYRPKPSEWPETGYLVFPIDDDWSWLYQEPGEPDEIGPRFNTRAAALRGAADDWEHNGGEHLPRFIGSLRGLASREEKR